MKTMLDVGFIAAGGNKKLYGERIPFFKIKDEYIIESTLDTVVNSDVKSVIIWSDQKERLDKDVLSKRTDMQNNYKPVHVVNAKERLGDSFLDALCQYTKINDILPSYEKNSWTRHGYKEYIEKNPICRDIDAIVFPCDIPLASYNNINKCIENHMHENKKSGVEFSILFTQKRYVNRLINLVSNIIPGFNERYLNTDTTLHNFMTLSKKRVRLSNIYILYPYRVHPRMYDVASDLYVIRHFANPKNIPKIKNLVNKYFNNPDLKEYIPNLLMEIAKTWLSSERINLPRIMIPLRGFIRQLSLGGGSGENLCHYTEKLSGLKTTIDFTCGVGAMMDLDDEEFIKLVNTFYPTFKEIIRQSGE